MCGRFTLTDIDAFFSRYRIILKQGINIQPHYNIAPTQFVPVIYQEGKIELMKWGLVPFWAKDSQIGHKMINARSETLTQKPSFKHLLKQNRCIVPCSGFYEWKKIDKQKVPYYIEIKDSELLSFAGLYDIWKDSAGNELKTFTIITTNANNTLKPIHNRMPVILEKGFEEKWIDDKFQDVNSLIQMLKPYPDENMIAYAVSTEVNSPKNDSSELLKKI